MSHFSFPGPWGDFMESLRERFSDSWPGWGDVFWGTPEADDLEGTIENDIIIGRGEDDDIDGLAGNDWIRGGSGDDDLLGGTGDDWLRGGRGDDHLNGGSDDDRLTGNRGADTFVFGKGGGDDTITDLKFHQGDTLDLTAFVGGPAGVVDSLDELHALDTASDAFDVTEEAGGDLLLKFNTGETLLLENLDGGFHFGSHAFSYFDF